MSTTERAPADQRSLTLSGCTIGVTADRRAQDQIAMLERRGADTIHGPTLGTAYLGDEDALHDVTRRVVDQPPDVFVANTGVGVRAWLDAASSWELRDPLLEALGAAAIVARGPKAAGAVRRAGLEVDDVAPGERLEEVGELLLGRGVAGQRVVVQRHGEDHAAFRDRLVAAGAEVLELPVYRWRLPADPEPAHRLIDAVLAGAVDAVTFTSAPAARNLVAFAADRGLDGELRRAFGREVVAVCVGPVCADAARAEGLSGVVAPEVGRMGHMIRVLEDALAGDATGVG